MQKFGLFTSVVLSILNNAAAIPCYKCNSALLPECAVIPAGVYNLPSEECTSVACAVTIVDGDTYRGCQSNTPIGPKYYKLCSTPHCNGGVYPPGRLKCHICDGPNCVPAPDLKPTACRNHVEEDKCFTHVEHETRVVRGCQSDGNIPETFVQYCDYNGCNNRTALQTIVCTECDSQTGRDCKRDLFNVNAKDCLVTNSNQCTMSVLMGRTPEYCFTYHKWDIVKRGCSTNSNSSELQEQTDFYESCDTDFCNRKCLEQSRCVVCNSDRDPLCKSRADEMRSNLCVSSETSSCHTCELRNGTILRGCGRPESILDGSCTQCQGGDGCNREELAKCYECQSDNDPNCSQWTNATLIQTKVCPSGDECVTVIRSDGHTERGCRSTLDAICKNSLDCQACSGELCNMGAYAKQLNCYQCNGSETCRSAVEDSELRPCVRYDAENRCFEFLDRDHQNMIRGCKSDHQAYLGCRQEEANRCVECAADGCNASPAATHPILACHKCKSSDDPSCGWSQDGSSTPEACWSDVLYRFNESCYIHEELDGNISRGCTLDDSPLEDKGHVDTCDTLGCNKESFYNQSCFQCSSSETLACAHQAEGLTPSDCGRENLSYEMRGCYVKREEYIITRGCAVKLTKAEVMSCQTDAVNTNNCIYCNGQSCNSMEAPGNSNKNSVTILVFILCLCAMKIV